MAQTCRRCGEVFEELVDGGCPGCGRAPSAAKGGAAAPRRPSPRVQASAGGRGAWGLIALAAVAVLGGGGWLVYAKVTAKPPPAEAPVAKKRTTLKDWEAWVPAPRMIPAMDALRGVLAKADAMPLEDLADALDRVVEGANHTEARVMLLSGLQGRKGKAAAGVLALLARRLFAYQHFGEPEDLGHLQAVTIRSVLEHAGDADADARHGVAACLRLLSSPLTGPGGKRIWEMEASQKAAVRQACETLRQDAKPETRESAEKALEHLDRLAK